MRSVASVWFYQIENMRVPHPNHPLVRVGWWTLFLKLFFAFVLNLFLLLLLKLFLLLFLKLVLLLFLKLVFLVLEVVFALEFCS